LLSSLPVGLSEEQVVPAEKEKELISMEQPPSVFEEQLDHAASIAALDPLKAEPLYLAIITNGTYFSFLSISMNSY
jgi:hypothetical protein